MLGFKPHEIDPRALAAGRNLPEGKRAQARIRRADGGKVRGPGTGTSDDIPVDLPEGAYVMPADSTREIGEQNLSGLGFHPQGSVPARVSNGEYILPPGQVNAVGVAMLDAMRDATHRVSEDRGQRDSPMYFRDGGGLGFRGRTRFKDGGEAEEFYAKNRRQAPTFNEDLGNIARGVAGGFQRFMERGRERPIVARPPEFVNSEAGRMAALQDLASDKAPSVAPAPAPGVDSPSAPTTAAVSSAASASSPVTDPAPAGQAQTNTEISNFPGVYRNGNRFTDDPARAAVTGGFTGEDATKAATLVNAPQMPSAIGSGFGFSPGNAMKAQLAGMGAQGAGFGFNTPRPAETGPRVTMLGDSSQEERERAAAFSAASTPIQGARGLTANQQRILAGLREGYERRELNAENNAAALERERMQQAGANQRQAIAGAFDLQRAQPAMEGQGFQNALSRRLESAYAKYDAAKTDDEKSAALREIALFGGGGGGKGDKKERQYGFMKGEDGNIWATNPETGDAFRAKHPAMRDPEVLAALQNKTPQEQAEALKRLGVSR
jgi:hypothetical protein